MKLAPAKALAIAAIALSTALGTVSASSLADQQTLTQTDTAIIEMKVGKIGFLIGCRGVTAGFSTMAGKPGWT
jgi:hypothetical protein